MNVFTIASHHRNANDMTCTRVARSRWRRRVQTDELRRAAVVRVEIVGGWARIVAWSERPRPRGPWRTAELVRQGKLRTEAGLRRRSAHRGSWSPDACGRPGDCARPCHD